LTTAVLVAYAHAENHAAEAAELNAANADTEFLTTTTVTVGGPKRSMSLTKTSTSETAGVFGNSEVAEATFGNTETSASFSNAEVAEVEVDPFGNNEEPEVEVDPFGNNEEPEVEEDPFANSEEPEEVETSTEYVDAFANSEAAEAWETFT